MQSLHMDSLGNRLCMYTQNNICTPTKGSCWHVSVHLTQQMFWPTIETLNTPENENSSVSFFQWLETLKTTHILSHLVSICAHFCLKMWFKKFWKFLALEMRRQNLNVWGATCAWGIGNAQFQVKMIHTTTGKSSFKTCSGLLASNCKLFVWRMLTQGNSDRIRSKESCAAIQKNCNWISEWIDFSRSRSGVLHFSFTPRANKTIWWHMLFCMKHEVSGELFASVCFRIKTPFVRQGGSDKRRNQSFKQRINKTYRYQFKHVFTIS